MIARLTLIDRTGALEEQVLAAANALPVPPDTLEVATSADLDSDNVAGQVLVLGPKELTQAGLTRLGKFRAQQPETVVLAVRGEGSPTKAVLTAAGVDVVLARNPSVAALTAALEHVAQRLAPTNPTPSSEPESESSAASSTETVPEAEPQAEAEAATEGERAPALVLTIASPTGGCGKTFFSTNLTAHLVAAGVRPLLVDLDLQFGEVAAALQVKHPHSIYDGFYDAAGRPLPPHALERHLDELVCHHPLGFDLLTAPRDPALADYITAEDIERLLLVVAHRYDVIVVDTPPSLNDVTLTVIDRSDVIGVMTTLDVPSLRNLTALLDILGQLDVSEDRVRLLLNKVESDIGLDVKQAQDAFGGRFVATIPANKGASRSINTGTVVLQSEPRSPLARALVTAIEAVVPAEVLPRGVDHRRHASVRTTRLTSLLHPRRTAPGGTS